MDARTGPRRRHRAPRGRLPTTRARALAAVGLVVVALVVAGVVAAVVAAQSGAAGNETAVKAPDGAVEGEEAVEESPAEQPSRVVIGPSPMPTVDSSDRVDELLARLVAGALLVAVDVALWVVLRPLDPRVWGEGIGLGRFVALLVTAPVCALVLAGRRVQALAYGHPAHADAQPAHADAQPPQAGSSGAAVGLAALAVVALLLAGVGRVAAVWARPCPPPAGQAGTSAPGAPSADAQPPSWHGGRWEQTGEAPLRPRGDHTAVWTGERMLVWGGEADHPEPGVTARFADGAAFRPDADLGPGSWERLAPAPLQPRSGHTAVWTGEELLVWGGQTSCHDDRVVGDGAAYDPDTDTWRTLASAPLAPRRAHTAVWTGDEMLVWGGWGPPQPGAAAREFADGAAYDPDSDTWRRLPDAPLHPRGAHTAVWTGEAMLVVGGGNDSPPLDASRQAARYTPATDEWTRLPSDALGARRESAGVWTGEAVLVVGGRVGPDAPQAVAHDPDTGTTQALPAPPHDGDNAVWTGRELILWHGRTTEAHPAASAYDPETDQWRPLPDPPVETTAGASAVWTGEAMLTWGGLHPDHETLLNTGAVYHPPPR